MIGPSATVGEKPRGALTPCRPSPITVQCQGVARDVLPWLHRHVTEDRQGTLREKNAAACLLWISKIPLAEIERTLTQFGRSSDAAGPVRSVSSRTRDLVPIVAKIAELRHEGLVLDDRVQRLLARLEVGASSSAAYLAMMVGGRLSRADYQVLDEAGLAAPEAIEQAEDETLLRCLEGDSTKLGVLREAVERFTEQTNYDPTVPLIPPYEG